MKLFAILALALAIGLATAVSPYASSSPDGLEKVAGESAFEHRARTHESPVPDYAVPGIENAPIATGLAGFAGTLVVFGVGSVVALAARHRQVAV
jgi:hypothetical protein